MPRNTICKITTDVEKNFLSFGFTDGETVNIKPSDFNQDVLKHAMLAGLKVTLSGAYNKVTTPAEAMKALNERIVNLKEGKWSTRGAGGPKITDLAKAVAIVLAITPEAARESLATMGKEKNLGVRANAKVQLQIKNIQEARAKAGRKDLEKAASDAEDLVL